MGRGDEGLNEARAYIGSYFSYEPRGDLAARYGAKTPLLRIRANEFGQEFDHDARAGREIAPRGVVNAPSAATEVAIDSKQLFMSFSFLRFGLQRNSAMRCRPRRPSRQ
jgi:hypothetical protein